LSEIFGFSQVSPGLWPQVEVRMKEQMTRSWEKKKLISYQASQMNNMVKTIAREKINQETISVFGK
jgi:hypothetical protein